METSEEDRLGVWLADECISVISSSSVGSSSAASSGVISKASLGSDSGPSVKASKAGKSEERSQGNETSTASSVDPSFSAEDWASVRSCVTMVDVEHL